MLLKTKQNKTQLLLFCPMLLWSLSFVSFFCARRQGRSSVPDQRPNLGPLQWMPGVLTTRPPGKSQAFYFCINILSLSISCHQFPILNRLCSNRRLSICLSGSLLIFRQNDCRAHSLLIFSDEKTDSDLPQVVKPMDYEEKSQEKLGKEKKWEAVLLDIKIYLEAVAIKTTFADIESVE